MNVALLTRDDDQNVALLERATAPAAPAILTTGLPNARVGVLYDQLLQITGSPSPTVTVDGLPAGVTFNPATRRLGGFPEAPGAHEIEITATNSEGSATRTLTLIVPNEGVGFSLPVITTILLEPSEIEVDQGSTYDLVVTFLDENDEPIANLMGDPSSSNESAATVEQLAVSDEAGRASVIVTGVGGGSATITVACDGATSGEVSASVYELFAPQIPVQTLPPATFGVPYSYQVAYTGHPAPTLTVIAGALPTGLTMSATGLISGTPVGSSAQAFAFTAQAANSEGQASRALSLPVAVQMVPPTITTVALPTMTAGAAYNTTLDAAGGAPISWSVGAGALPPGLSLNASTGAITGTPTSSGPFTFTIVATNAAGSHSREFSVVVAVPAGNRLVITQILADAMQDEDVRGFVCAAPATGDLIGQRLGEFKGKRFVADGDSASLTLAASEVGAGSLPVGTKVRVYLEDSDESTSVFEAEISAG